MQLRKPYSLDNCLLIWVILEKIYYQYIYIATINQPSALLKVTTTMHTLSTLSYTGTIYIIKFKAV